MLNIKVASHSDKTEQIGDILSNLDILPRNATLVFLGYNPIVSLLVGKSRNTQIEGIFTLCKSNINCKTWKTISAQ